MNGETNMKYNRNYGFNVLSARESKIRDRGQQIHVIDLHGGHTIQLYWTPTRGTMGYQCMSLWYTKNELQGAYLTAGYGYDKQGAALWAALRALGIRPRGGFIQNEIPHKYHAGGNYYKVKAKDAMKWPKNEKYKTTSAKIAKEWH